MSILTISARYRPVVLGRVAFALFTLFALFAQPASPAAAASCQVGVDSDGDEVYIYGTNPLVFDALQAGRPDGDGDGLYDDDESEVYFTDDSTWDTDGDGSGDGEEVYYGTDPNDFDSTP
jgi:hypothetical protein